MNNNVYNIILLLLIIIIYDNNNIVNCITPRPVFTDINECQFNESFIIDNNSKDIYLSSTSPSLISGEVGSKTNPYTSLTDAWSAALSIHNNNNNNNNISINIRVLSGVYSFSLTTYPKTIDYEYLSGWNDPISIANHPSINISKPNLQLIADDIKNPPLFTSRINAFYNNNNNNNNLWERVPSTAEIFANDSIRMSINQHIEYLDDIHLYRSKLPLTNYFPMYRILKPLIISGFINTFIPYTDSNKNNIKQRVALIPYYNFAELVSKYQTRMVVNGKSVVPNYVAPGVFFDYVRCWKLLIEQGDINATDIQSQIDALSDGLEAYYNKSLTDKYACHLYIRLDPTENAKNLEFSYSSNPNQHSLTLTDGFQFVFTRLSRFRLSYIHFEVAKIQFTNLHDVRIDNCRFFVSGSRIDVNSAQRVSFSKCEFTLGFPLYLYWTDLKNSFDIDAGLISRSGNQGPASALHESVLLIRHAYTRCIAVENSYIHRSWFGIYITHCDSCFIRHNKLEFIHNDAIMYASNAVTSADISFNRITDSYNGLSQVPVGHFTLSALTLPPNDERTLAELSACVALHHNIVYLPYSSRWCMGKLRPSNETQPISGFNGDSNDKDYGYACNCAVFIGHASGTSTAFQLYNNLLITNTHFTQTLSLATNNDGNQIGYVINNIIIQLDAKGRLARPFNINVNVLSSNDDVKGIWLDGNVWYRASDVDDDIYNSGPDFDSWYGVDYNSISLQNTTPLQLNEVCNQSQVYDTSYLYNNMPFVVALYEFNTPQTCEYRQIHSQICLTSNFYYNYRSVRDILCDHPRIKVEKKINNTHYSALNPISTSALNISLECYYNTCRNMFMGNMRYKKIVITKTQMYVENIKARIKMFDFAPYSNENFVGACDNELSCKEIGSSFFQTNQSDNNNNEETNSLIIIIIAMGGGILLLILLCAVMYMKRRHSKQHKANQIRKQFMIDNINSSSTTELQQTKHNSNYSVTNYDINQLNNFSTTNNNNNWQKFYTDDGVPYYWNSTTNESKWIL